METGTHDEQLSPQREKRVLEMVVTPNCESEEQENNKKMKTKYTYKMNTEVTPKNLMSNGCDAYVVSMRGNIDLFYFEQGNTEGFVNPIVELLFGSPTDHRNTQIHKQQLLSASKIIAVVPRRASLHSDEPEYKNGSGKTEPNAKFKKHYFVSYDPRTSNATCESKRNRLESVVTFLEQYRHTHPGPFDKRLSRVGEKRFFVVPEDYDQTPDVKERWDERMLDADVGRLMGMILQPKPSKNFAKEAPEIGDDFFSEPYSKYAQDQFGYGAF